MIKNKYCDYCGKPFGKPDTIYIAGTICQGHLLPIHKYLWYKLKRLLNKLKENEMPIKIIKWSLSIIGYWILLVVDWRLAIAYFLLSLSEWIKILELVYDKE